MGLIAHARSMASLSAGGFGALEQPMEPHSSHPDLPRLMLLVAEAVLEVVFVSLPGYIVARQGLFDAEAQKFVANLNVMVFTPCLIFTKLASQLNPQTFVELAIIPVIFAVQTLVSWLSALVMARIFRLRRRPRNFVIAMAVFGNSNSLPISLVLSLSYTIRGLHWDEVPGDTDSDVAARGILYLMIFQQLGQLVRWTWGYNVLLRPAEEYTVAQGGTADDEDDGAGRAEAGYRDDPAEEVLGGEVVDEPEHYHDDTDHPVAPPGRSNGRAKTRSKDSYRVDERSLGPHGDLFPPASSLSARRTTSYFNGHTNGSAGGRPPKPRRPSLLQRTTEFSQQKVASASARTRRALTPLFEALHPRVQTVLATAWRYVARFAGGVWAFMNPPLWAMLFAVLVASVPSLQSLFFTRGTFVNNSVTSAVSQSAGVAVPLILVVLGANLARNTLPAEEQAQTAADKREQRNLLVASLLARMLLPLLAMAPLLAVTARFVPVSILDDPIFVVVCFLLTGAPSALQLAQICQINGVYMGAMASLLFQSYVVWLLPSTLVLVACALEVVEWAQAA